MTGAGGISACGQRAIVWRTRYGHVRTSRHCQARYRHDAYKQLVFVPVGLDLIWLGMRHFLDAANTSPFPRCERSNP
jgi:hypothetical protein